MSSSSSHFKRLIEANQSLAEIESQDILFPKLLKLAKVVTQAEASSLLLYDPERKKLKFASIKDEILGDNGALVLKNSVELSLGEGIAGWVALNKQSVIIEDTKQDSRFSNRVDLQTGFHTRNLLCVPIVYFDELLGVINVLNSKEKEFFDTEDQELLESFAHLASVALIRSRLLEDKLQKQKLETQLETASKIQSLFWPEIPNMKFGSHVWAKSIPAIYVGGDLYDIIPMTDGSFIVYVADVAGKGLPAALIMVALWSKIREKAFATESVDKLLEKVNNAMYDLMERESYFATLILGRYWPEQGKMHLVRGGHMPPLWISNTGVKNIPKLKGVTLGIEAKVEFEKAEITIAPGESIIFFTDGITEAENEKHEMFGSKRLEDHFNKMSTPPWGESLLQKIKKWSGKLQANDDLTVLEIWRESDLTT